MTLLLYALLAVACIFAVVVGACVLVRMIDPDRSREGESEPELERLRRLSQ